VHRGAIRRLVNSHGAVRAAVGLLAAGFALASSGLSEAPAGRAPSFATREGAYRANNRGVALLEQFHHQEAAKAFRDALDIDPDLALARLNLAVALFNASDWPQAREAAQAAVRALPESPHAHYLAGLIARSQNQSDEAKAAFTKVLSLDPADVGSLVNLGQLHLQERRYAEAVECFRAAEQAEPYNTTALYNLGVALNRSGRQNEGQGVLERFRVLRESGYGSVLGQS